MTIDECVNKINGFVDKVADRGVEIMKLEVPVGRTGDMKKSVHKESMGKYERRVTPNVFYAKWVRNGRPQVEAPKANGKYLYPLKWIEYSGSQSSIHQPGGSGTVRAFVSRGPTEPNDYPVRTKEKLISQIKSLW